MMPKVVWRLTRFNWMLCGPPEKIGALNALQVVELAHADFLQVASGNPQAPSENCDGKGSGCRPKASTKQTFANISERQLQYIVRFAMLLCVGGGLFAYVYVNGAKYKETDDKRDSRDNPSSDG